jgi:hypothetical protein
VIGRVRQIVIDELPHLHDQDGVGGVGGVFSGAAVGAGARGVLSGEHVANLARGRQLEVVGGAATRKVDGAAGVFREEDPLVGRAGPPKVRVGEVVARAVRSTKYLGIIHSKNIGQRFRRYIQLN